MVKVQQMSDQQLDNHVVGEAVSLATVMAIVAVALVAVVVYRLFLSSDGKVQMPGGWKFEWN